MAFVDITIPKSPAGVAAWLLQCRAGKREFTPKLCYEVLQSTNFAKNIHDMLVRISELPAEKQADFKDIVLSTFDRREQPNDILVLGKKLAVAGGYEAELNNVNKPGDITGEYLFSGVGKRAGVAISVFVQRVDYSKYEEVFIASYHVDLASVDLSQVKHLRFKEGARVSLVNATLPADLDVSMCNYVDLTRCDLSNVKNLRFKNGAYVCLKYVEKMSANLDISVCDYVDLSDCDLSRVRNLRFKEGAVAYLAYAKNLPEDLDVSMCNAVNLYGCDLSMVESLCFKDWKQREESYAEIPDTVAVTYSEDAGASLGKMFKGRGGR